MKKTNQSMIQAKMFDFALSELVRNQRNSFEPMWTVDSWVKFLIWLSLNCGLPGDRDSLETFADALGNPLTKRMRKIFYERTIENLGLHVIADPSDKQIFVMPIASGQSITHEKCMECIDLIGLSEKVTDDFRQWELHDQLIAIPWSS